MRMSAGPFFKPTRCDSARRWCPSQHLGRRTRLRTSSRDLYRSPGAQTSRVTETRDKVRRGHARILGASPSQPAAPIEPIALTYNTTPCLRILCACGLDKPRSTSPFSVARCHSAGGSELSLVVGRSAVKASRSQSSAMAVGRLATP
jgi:hypothetical protein